jgi:urea transport system ATP-binding protein
MGLLPTRSGEIAFDGRIIGGLPPYSRAALGIGYVPQGRDIFPRLTVAENLQMGLATAKRGARIPEFIFEMFPVLEHMMSRRGGDLSGGQQQQLAIGRALAMRPRLLILDEPTEGIQPSIIKDIDRAIRKLLPQAISRFRWSSNITISPSRSPTAMSCSRAVRSSRRRRASTMDEDNVRAHLAV